jgi:hypothetical protein
LFFEPSESRVSHLFMTKLVWLTKSLVRSRAISFLPVLTYVIMLAAVLLPWFISSPSDRLKTRSRASFAALEALLENRNARMLKMSPATEAKSPQFLVRKSSIGPDFTHFPG